MADPVKRTRQRRKADRPREILDAAVEEFAEAGFAGAKIAKIADRAGVAKGTVYLYFETKEDIFKAIVNEKIQPVLASIERMAPELSELGSASQVLQQLIRHFYREMVEDEHRRMILRILISDGPRFPELSEYYHDEILSRARVALGRLVEAGIEQGEFRRSSITDAPMVIMGPALMAAVWKMTFEPTAPLPLANFIDAHIQMVLDALRVPTTDVQ